jgi:HPr kinase/phosphorylase
MQIHASCVALNGDGVILLGPSGAGKSDLALRLLDRGFVLVADDRVEVEDLIARPPQALAGLLEVRGLGLLRLPYLDAAKLALAVELGTGGERLPAPLREDRFGLPLIRLDPFAASAAQRVALALDCLRGRTEQMVGAFVA